MAPKKITLNELRTLVKQIIKEERMTNELFGFGGGKSNQDNKLSDATPDEMRFIYRWFQGKLTWEAVEQSFPKHLDAFKKSKTPEELYRNLGLNYPGRDKWDSYK
jgi:hypothetical protein